MASSRRLHGVQEKLRTPRCAQWDLLERRGVAVASPLDALGSPRTPCHGAHFVHAQSARRGSVFWMHAVRMPWVRNGNAVTAQFGLLEGHEDALRTQRGRIWWPQERRCSRWRLHGDLTECMETSLRLYRVLTAHLRRLHCAKTEFYIFHCVSQETTQSCCGDHRDTMAPPRSPSAFAGRLHCADTASTVVSYDLHKRMAHKPLLWTCSTNEKFPTLIKYVSEYMYINT